MKKLFLDFVPSGEFELGAEQSRHVAKSLRMKPGDTVIVNGADKNDYGCVIRRTGERVLLEVCYKQANESEPDVFVTLYQGVAKGDKLETIIQKCTELGVSRFVPVLTSRSVSRPDSKSAAKKKTRYEKIALEASQQSGRGIVPEICEMVNLENALTSASGDVKIIFYELGGEKLADIIDKKYKSIDIFIGPEGGFEKSEVESVLNAGGIAATLGARILRCETAPLAAASAIMVLTGNM